MKIFTGRRILLNKSKILIITVLAITVYFINNLYKVNFLFITEIIYISKSTTAILEQIYSAAQDMEFQLNLEKIL